MQAFTEEERRFLISRYADGLTSKEVAEAFYAEFKKRVPVGALVSFRREHRDAIQSEIADEVETASDYLSPAGLLRHAYRMLRKLKEDDYKGRLSDIATLLRFASEVWDKYHQTEEERQRMRKEIEEELKEMMTFFEQNRDLIETAQRNGLLRFVHLDVGGDKREASWTSETAENA